MNIQFHDETFVVCLIMFVIAWALTRHGKARSVFISTVSLIGAIMMPAFIPQGGGVAMVVPGAILFSTNNHMSWAIACFFLVVNYLVLSKIFSGISRKRAT